MKKKNNSNESGLAYGIIGLAGLALGALGTFLFNKVSDEEDEKEKEKEILLLKQEVAQKNRVIQAEKLKDDQQKNGYTSTNSENLLENENLYCPISNVLMDDPIIITKCGHTFQRNSLESWIKKKQTCPLCQISIKQEDIKPNFTMKALIADISKK